MVVAYSLGQPHWVCRAAVAGTYPRGSNILRSDGCRADDHPADVGGVGDRLGPVLKLPKLFAALVNPAVPLETAKVFGALGLTPGETSAADPHAMPAVHTTSELLAALTSMRNDLEAPARTLAPVIDEALVRVRETPQCRLARMSGSGTTVFGLFDDAAAAAAAANLLARARPAWWIKPTTLR